MTKKKVSPLMTQYQQLQPLSNQEISDTISLMNPTLNAFERYEEAEKKEDAVRERICPIDPAEANQCDSCQ